jgi:predicted transcriptional regulator
MARAALDWSTTDLARAANVGVNSVNRFETGRDSRISTVEKLRSALESAGMVFIAKNGGGVGVRFRETKAGKQTGV